MDAESMTQNAEIACAKWAALGNLPGDCGEFIAIEV
jgi:hypothetical protein